MRELLQMTFSRSGSSSLTELLEQLFKTRNCKTGTSSPNRTKPLIPAEVHSRPNSKMRSPMSGRSPDESSRCGRSSLMRERSPEGETDADLALALAKDASIVAADILEILEENVADLADVKTAMEAAPGRAVKDVVEGILVKGLENAMRKPDRRHDDPYLTDRREPEKPKKDYHQPLTGGDVPLLELKRRALHSLGQEQIAGSCQPSPRLTVNTNDSGKHGAGRRLSTAADNRIELATPARVKALHGKALGTPGRLARRSTLKMDEAGGKAVEPKASSR